MRRLATALALLALCAGPAAGAPDCTADRLTVLAGDTPRAFSVEVADDPDEQARGLMYRSTLAEDAGMLFVFEPPRPASFWMHNTMLPLDMIFIDAAGRVESIAERRDTFSDRISRSAGPVRAVLEINAGLSAHLGIGPGAQVIHPAFRDAPEAARCPD